MALIPSESLNFPDSFRASEGWRAAGKPPSPSAPIPRGTEPSREKNGEAESKKLSVDRTPSPPSSTVSTLEPPAPHPAPAEDKVPEKPKPQEEPKSEPEQPKAAVKAEEPKEVAQEQLATKPADLPKTAPAPPVETKPEEPRDLMPETPPNITPSPAGATLTGADAAALLSKIFFSPTAASSDLESIKSKTQSPESPAEPVTPDSAAAAKSSSSAAPVNSESAPEPNKELAKKSIKPIEPARKEFSINPQPTPPLGEWFNHDEAPNTIKIETAAQTKQVLDLIAAAAARGVLNAEPVPTTPPVTAPAPEKSAADASAPTGPVTKVETPEETKKISNVTVPAAAPSVLNAEAVPATSPAATSPSATGNAEDTSVKPAPPEPNIEPPAAAALEQPLATESSQPAPKTPAKIRIQPRKIKPRPFVPSTAETGVAEPEIAGPEIDIPDSVALAPVGADKLSVAAPPPKEEVPRKPAYREWAESGMPLPRSDENQSSGELFTARDARNQWIRFGLGEFAALAVFVVLLSYALRHKFPDPTLKLLIFILMFAVGALAIALPVLFIRNHPSRWQRRALNYRRDHDNYF